nr:hypothetical protein [Bacteroidota bacterium]
MARHHELASGLIGDGRMEEPSTLRMKHYVHYTFQIHRKQTAGGLTAGPTREAIDPVRFIQQPFDR